MKSIVSFSIIISLAWCTAPEKDIENNPITSPVNLLHALSLVDSMKIDGETLTFIRIYADAPSYEPVPAVGEGITCVDDVGRFMEVLETEILTYGNSDLTSIARGMTHFLLYMSREDGLWHNFMFADGSINTTHKNSIAEFGWWAIRGLRGLAAAYNIFSYGPENVQLLEKVKERIAAADRHIQKAVRRYPSRELTELGMKPAWLVKNAPDINSELLIALTKLHNTGDFDYLDTIEKISVGLIEYQYQEPEHDLNGMYFCWKNIWHNWGNNHMYGLLEAYKITDDSTVLSSTKIWADSFVPFLIKNDYPREITVSYSQEYSVVDMPQIAYGFNSIYRGLRLLAEITGETIYFQRSEEVFLWFKGNNIANTPMYIPDKGRCFDGINGYSSINTNSGAESTIECLLAIQERGAF
ncbi:MAG: hypothetical protein IID16_03260 [Candidatus Marinimicrobia bacterium]|nr:hypothetical protein [Candidatus Neomarinimicrobiota bacterium]